MRRYAPWIIIAIGIALAAAAITANFTADDHLQRVIARPDPGIAGLHSRPLDLFVFADGNVADTAALRDGGLFPWWADDHVRLSFFRPITSLTHALDRVLWPDCAAAQLAHNLVWLAAGLVLVWFLYRRFLPRGVALLALALYAWDDARGPVVGWIANRNALVALVLAIPVLLAHDRWRRDGWARGRWLGPALFAVSLGAGESAIAIAGYLFAHALWLDRGRVRDRLLALAPYVAIVVAWRVVYGHLGYGVYGSGIYLDPGSQPIAYAAAAGTRLPFLLVGQLALPWSDLSSFYTVLGITPVMLAIALAVVAAIGLACARILRRDPIARFFATGMVLAAVPIASTFPADRLLSFVGLGAMGLVAQLLHAAVRDRALLGDGRPRRIACLAVAAVLALVNLVLSPPLLVLRSRGMVAVGRVIDRADAGVPSDPTKTVIIASTPSDALAGYVPVMRKSRGQPCPAHIYWLATATTAVTLERVDDRTLRILPRDGLLRYDIDQMTRSPATHPFAVGDKVALTGLSLETRAVSGGRPTEILAHFAVPLEDPSLVWLRWEGHTYVPYAPPALGARDTLPAVDFLGLLGD
jgi:hypothetical protein